MRGWRLCLIENDEEHFESNDENSDQNYDWIEINCDENDDDGKGSEHDKNDGNSFGAHPRALGMDVDATDTLGGVR